MNPGVSASESETEDPGERVSRSSSEGGATRLPLELIGEGDAHTHSNTHSNSESPGKRVESPIERVEISDVKSNVEKVPNNVENREDKETNGERTRKKKCLDCCHRLWRPCLVAEHPLPEQPTRRQRLAHAWMCPTHGHVARWLTMSLTLALFWGVLWSLTGPAALPGGNFFGLIVLFIFCILGGTVRFVCNHTHVHKHARRHTHTHTHTHTHSQRFTDTRAHKLPQHTHKHIHTFRTTRADISKHTYTLKHTFRSTHALTHIRSYTNTKLVTHTHTNTHTYLSCHTHTYLCPK